MISSNNRYAQAKKITLLGAFVNAVLGVLKMIGGILYNSHALIADGLHSFSDLLTDAMVLFASKYGSQDADETHQYGHQRIETAGTLLLALLLILAGAAIAWDAFEATLTPSTKHPHWLALPIAIISIVCNEALFFATRHIGRSIESALLTANAWHHRSDSASSAIVAIGIIGSLLGWSHFDAIAAIIVGFMIIKMGLAYGWNSVKELVDTAIEPELLEEIQQFIQHVNGVKKIHQLRSRSMGGDVIIDLHVLVDPFISVSEGHFIAQHVHYLLKRKLPKVKDVTVHIDPEDDELVCPSIRLPNRQQLEKDYILSWQKACPEITHWTLHYLDGKIIIDLFCTPQFSPTKSLSSTITRDIAANKLITEVRFNMQQPAIMA